MKPTRLLISAIALAACSLSAFAQNLISNGTFDAYTGPAITPGSNNFQTVNAGVGSITGWTVGGTSVDVINNGAYGAISGNSIDMLGTPGPGSLSQSFSSTSGQQYLLNFDLSCNVCAAPQLGVSINGGAQTLFTGTLTAASQHQTMNFTAVAGATTLLTFYGIPAKGDFYSGAVLDNVSVTAVPEPETFAILLSGLGLMGSIGRRRSLKAAASA